jgi:selenocysteine-specific elongation factor
VTARVRPLGGDTARLTLARPLPLVAGDRAILRDPGSRAITGALVLDADPPAPQRRGAAARRAAELESYTGTPDLAVETRRRGALPVATARLLGIVVPQGVPPAGVVVAGDWLVAQEALDQWAERLLGALEAQARAHPLQPDLSLEAARAAAGVPDRALVPQVARQAGLELRDGRVVVPGATADLGAAEEALRAVELRLAELPFAAPERGDLAEAGLNARELAAAERAGRLVRLGDDVVLLPDAPARAMRVLAGLPQPFTLSEARRSLDTTRRVAVPLLEHLDRRGWTRRVSATHREVVR